MLTLEYSEVAALANYKCYYEKIVDLAETIGAFDAKAAPTVRFQTCEHIPASPERVQEFKDFLMEEAIKSHAFYAEISDGLVVQNLQSFGMALTVAGIKFWNNAFVRFAVLHKDEWGRVATSYGSYGQHGTV